jgi:hypothetical protein
MKINTLPIGRRKAASLREFSFATVVPSGMGSVSRVRIHHLRQPHLINILL